MVHCALILRHFYKKHQIIISHSEVNEIIKSTNDNNNSNNKSNNDSTITAGNTKYISEISYSKVHYLFLFYN